MKNTRKIPLLVGVAAALALGLAACAPGSGSGSTAGQSLGPVSKNVGSDKVTLTVWDQNTDGGIDTAQQQLNTAFEKKYPNVTIKRVSRSFTDLKTTLKLALSGANPPDVVQANQGYPDMGAFVKAGLLRPVNDYADLYGWNDYYPSSLLKLNSFSSDGKTWQGDKLFGVSQTGELVGVYYNRDILKKLGVEAPTSLTELSDDMAKAKAQGILPLSYGDVEKSPGIHLYGVVQGALAGQKKVSDLVTSTSGAWTDPVNVEAAKTIQDWQNKGYLTPGANGVSRDAAVDTFGKGGSAFLITGTWYQATLEESSLGKSGVGFTALKPEGASTPVTTGGEGLAWALTSKTKHPDAAAAYVNFVTDKSASETLVKTGNLPTVVPDDDKPADGTLAGDITSEYKTISSGNGIVPYLDYTTSTFYDTLTAAMQDLVAGKATPEEFTKTLQADYTKFQSSRG
ncbi:extracellular solute-binding protein [Leifsonia poae]|uniref:extracellular solute-binding protein n=1 Tax=Leifsonia poae TaxID=110933 RepID=UPI003D663DC3